VSRRKERKRRWEAEQERQHAEDLAQAGRIGADFGLGELRTTARYKQARSGWIFLGGMFVAIGGLVTGVAFGAADVRYTLAAEVAVPAASAGAVLLGAQLMRTGARTRAVRQLFWYSGGLAQQNLDEPEPRVLRWEEVDSFTPLIYDDSGCVAGGRLRGRTGTEITVSLGYGLRYLVGEADRMLADRLVPELVGAYEAGEPIAAGQWRIGQAGLTRVRGDGREALTPWRDIRTIEQRRDCELTIGLGGRRRRTISLAGVPNGMFIARLVEHAFGQNGIPVTRAGHKQVGGGGPGS
jgi:hypothetical protein